MTSSPRRRLAIGAAIALLLGGLGVAVGPRLVRADRIDPTVASIRLTPEYQDAALLDAAWRLPVAASYRQGGIEFQRNVSFCGPAAAVNVLRSLGTRARQDSILDGTGVSTIFGYLRNGLTLDQLADVVRHASGRPVTVLRDLDLAGFRAELAHANDPARRYVVNFHRRPLFGTGGGHHSPIAGYLAEHDLVLVLDVNRDYQPWLVSPERLFAAMNTVDRGAEKKRGLLRIE